MERSKALLKKAGWPLMAVVERWNPHCRIRQDLFGFIDLLAVNKNEILAVQVTTAGHVADHLAKIRENAAHLIWLSSPSRRIVVHGWGKFGPRGKRKVWECRSVEVILTAEQVFSSRDLQSYLLSGCDPKITPEGVLPPGVKP